MDKKTEVILDSVTDLLERERKRNGLQYMLIATDKADSFLATEGESRILADALNFYATEVNDPRPKKLLKAAIMLASVSIFNHTKVEEEKMRKIAEDLETSKK